MGRRQRQRARGAAPPRAPDAQYDGEDESSILLRSSLTPATRAAYARLRSGADLSPGASREDAWQRSVEFLFERLAVSWTISGAPALRGQRELLARLRAASPQERAWLRDRLREHCAEHFPELDAP
jgi:hypothetical protein